jgi:hypothetical protein
MLQFIEAVGVKYNKNLSNLVYNVCVFYSHIKAEAPRMAASDSFK